MTATTVILPTSAGRGACLDVAIPSTLRQSVTDFEVIVVGDGVDDSTRATIERWCSTDERVRFVDRPKHRRRGEPYRHEILSERSHGGIVAYLLDRDVWFSDHLAELQRLLADADFAATLPTHDVGDRLVPMLDRPMLTELAAAWRWGGADHVAPMSTVGHRLDAYHRLPHGWRETPPGTATDSYMWRQFLDQHWIRVADSGLPTVAYLQRPPGTTPDERARAARHWATLLTAPGGEASVRADVATQVRDAMRQEWRRSVRGRATAWKHRARIRTRFRQFSIARR